MLHPKNIPMAPGISVALTPEFIERIFYIQMLERCQLFQKKIKTEAKKRFGIKDFGGGKISKYIDRGASGTTVLFSLACGITVAMGFVTFGAASFAGACVAGVTLVAKVAVEEIKKNKIEKVLTAAEEAKVSSCLNFIMKDVAKELSRIFESQLYELGNGEIEILAKCAVDLMLDLNKNDKTFDRNTLIRKVLQDGKISEKKFRTRKGKKWSAPNVFRKPGLRRVIWEEDVAKIKYFIKSSEDSKSKKDACDTSTYGYRGQFLEMKKYPNQQEEDVNIKEEADKRDDLREDFCKECFSNDENCTSRRYFVESDIDSKYIEPQDEPYRYNAMHILIQCPQILVSFSQLNTSVKSSLANFLKKKLGLPENLLVHPVYRPHSPAKVPNLKNSDLTGSDFSYSDFRDSCLEKCNFTKCVMLFVELDRANMSGSKFCETFMGHSRLRGVKAIHCEWTDMRLLYSRVEGARLDSAVSSVAGNKFKGTNMCDATTGLKPDKNCNESKYKRNMSFYTVRYTNAINVYN